MAGWTLQSLIDGKMRITAYCQRSECNHHQALDLEKLRDKFGPEMPAMAFDLQPKLRCSKCGGKRIGVTYTPDGDKVSGMGSKNVYAQAKGREG